MRSLQVLTVLLLLAGCGSAHTSRGKQDGAPDATGSLRAECDRGDGRSCTWVGISYQEGDLYPGSGFVPQDYDRANVYYSRGCEIGHMEGCVRRGRLYKNGQGVPADAATAIALFKVACERESVEGCQELRDMTSARVEPSAPVPSPRPDTPPPTPAPAATPSPTTVGAIPTEGWWCATSEINVEKSGCNRAEWQCEEFRRAMAQDGYQYGKCESQPRASCFDYRNAIEARTFESCHASTGACARHRAGTAKDPDRRPITQCELRR